MALISYPTLGRSGLKVSPLCLGAMTFGESRGWGSPVTERQQMLDRYIAAGGRHSSRRDPLILASKFISKLYIGDPNGGGSGVER